MNFHELRELEIVQTFVLLLRFRRLLKRNTGCGYPFAISKKFKTHPKWRDCYYV